MRGSAPRPQRLPTEDLYDVDDGPLLRKRKLVKGICVTQILICLGLTAISIRRARILLVLVPFFLSAGVLGYLGADNCRPAYIAAHFMGSGGLSLVFFLYILGESFLKRSGSDLYFFAISFPNDLFMLCTAGFSISLYFDLQRYQKQLAAKREQMREQFEHIGARIASSAVSSECAAAVERRLESNPTLKNDLRCPISLEVMRDPVIAADGHSYEREAITRWLGAHRTSPLTGRPLANTSLVPNHRLRSVIQDLGLEVEEPAAAAAADGGGGGGGSGGGGRDESGVEMRLYAAAAAEARSRTVTEEGEGDIV